MSEHTLIQQQGIAKENVYLTQPNNSLYAKGRTMAENTQDTLPKQESPIVEIKPIQVEAPHKQEEEIVLKKQEKPADVKKAEASWDEKVKDGVTGELEKVAELCGKNGITFEEFQANKDTIFKDVFKSPENKAQFERMVREWRRVLDPSDFAKNKQRVWELAAKGTGLKQFVEQNPYNWPFETPLAEALKRKNMLGLFMTSLKAILNPMLEDIQAKPAEASEEKMELKSPKGESVSSEKQKAAELAWKIINSETQQGDFAEKQTQRALAETLAAQGKGPDVAVMNAVIGREKEEEVYRNARLTDVDREDEAENVIMSCLSEEMKKKFKLDEHDRARIIKIHEIGRDDKLGKDNINAPGVHNYRLKHILAKTRDLKELLVAKGITNSTEQSAIARALFEKGILGDPPDGGEGYSGPGAGVEPGATAKGPDDTLGGASGATSEVPPDPRSPAEASDPTKRKKDYEPKGFSSQTIVDALEEMELAGDDPKKIDNEKRRRFEEAPRNIEDLAWQISYLDEAKWGTAGDFPLLKKENGEWKVDKSNFMRWIRSSMVFLHDRSPDSIYDYGREIMIPKDYRPINVDELLKHPGRYFRSAKENDAEKRNEPKLYQDLVDEIERETWLFGATRQFDIEYRQVMGQENEMAKTVAKLYYNNTFTKTVWGKSSLYWMMTQDADFKGEVKGADGKYAKAEGDHKTGAAINSAYEAYYNIADPALLRQYLGEKSSLLNKGSMVQARNEIAGVATLTPEEEAKLTEDEKRIRKEKIDLVLSDANIAKIFDKGDGPDGINPKEFHEYLNFYRIPEFNARAASLVRKLVKQDIAEKFDLYIKDPATGQHKLKDGKKVMDTDQVDYAEITAHTMMFWTGGAGRNDWEATGHNAWSKLRNTRPYRMKQARGKSGGAFGNPYTLHQIRGLATDFVSGVRTESKIGQDEVGLSAYANKDREGNWKTPIEIFHEIAAAGGDAKKIEAAASQLMFPDLTMRQYSNNHINRAMGIFQSIVDGEEIKLEKFTKVDPLKGVVFERDQFAKVVQEGFLKPLRYCYSTWGQLDFTLPVRAWNADKKMETMSLAEAMFGRELLDIPEFWKKDDVNGTWVDIIVDGKRVREKRVKNVIDPKEVQDNKAQLWKQIAKTRIAAELYAHVDLHSSDPRYDFTYYETIIRSLEQIPGGILKSDDTDMKSTLPDIDPLKRFFTEDDIKWIREKSNTKKGRLFMWAMLKAIGLGIWKGSTEGVSKGLKYAIDWK